MNNLFYSIISLFGAIITIFAIVAYNKKLGHWKKTEEINYSSLALMMAMQFEDDIETIDNLSRVPVESLKNTFVYESLLYWLSKRIHSLETFKGLLENINSHISNNENLDIVYAEAFVQALASKENYLLATWYCEAIDTKDLNAVEYFEDLFSFFDQNKYRDIYKHALHLLGSIKNLNPGIKNELLFEKIGILEEIVNKE